MTFVDLKFVAVDLFSSTYVTDVLSFASAYNTNMDRFVYHFNMDRFEYHTNTKLDTLYNSYSDWATTTVRLLGFVIGV